MVGMRGKDMNFFKFLKKINFSQFSKKYWVNNLPFLPADFNFLCKRMIFSKFTDLSDGII